MESRDSRESRENRDKYNKQNLILHLRYALPRRLKLPQEVPWTQAQVAELLGISSNYAAILERGEKQPGVRVKLAGRYLLALTSRGIDPREL